MDKDRIGFAIKTYILLLVLDCFRNMLLNPAVLSSMEEIEVDESGEGPPRAEITWVIRLPGWTRSVLSN